MSYNNQTIFELLDTYKEKTLELIAVLDINMIEKPYYYKVVFQDIDTKKDLPPVHIPPELLRYRYRIGNVYHDEKLVKNTMPKINEFEIDTSEERSLSKISQYLNDSDIGFINERNRKYFLEQRCYYFSYDEYDLIIPCYTIANRYLFLSSSMKKAAFDGSLESLYYSGTFKRDGRDAFVEVKHAIAKRDILYLCRFLDNRYAFSKFTYIANQRHYINKQKPFVPIKAKFLTKEKFLIRATTRKIIKENKPIYFVTNILNDTSTIDFDYVKYKKYSSKAPRPESDEEINVKKPVIPLKVPKRTTENVGVGVTPSSEYLNHFTADYVEPDLNREGIELEEQKVFKESNVEVEYENTDDIVDKGFEPSSESGDDSTRHNSHTVVDQEDEVEKNIFDFANFAILYNALIQEQGVSHRYLSDPTTLKLKKNDNGHTPLRYFLVDNKTIRSFYHGAFYYDDKQVFVLEIELDPRWSNLSTWFFVSDDISLDLCEGNFQHILSEFLKGHKNYSEFSEFLYNSYGLKFIRKKHQDVYNEESISTWAENVLDLIGKTDNMNIIAK